MAERNPPKAKRRRRTPGTGCLFKRHDKGPWRLRWWDHTGRRRERSSATTDKATALRVLSAQLADEALRKHGIIDGRADTFAEHGRRLLADVVTEYLTHCRNSGQAPKHIDEKTRHLHRLVSAMGNAPRLADLDADALEKHLWAMREAGRSARTVNFARQIAVAFASWAERTGRLERNPLKHVPRLDENADRRKVRRALTDAELARLLAVARERGREAWYLLAAYGGLRRGDLKRLEWRDVDFEAATITIRGGKAKRIDTIPLHPMVVESLKAHKSRFPALQAAKVFRTAPTSITVRKDFTRAGIAALDDDGRTADLHCLRATLATALARQNVTPQVAQRILRHADYRTTLKHYVTLGIHDMAGAVAKLPAVQLEAEAAQATGTEDATAENARHLKRHLKGREIVPNRARPCGESVKSCHGGEMVKSAKTTGKCGVLRDDASRNTKAGDGIRTHDVQLGKLAFYH